MLTPSGVKKFPEAFARGLLEFCDCGLTRLFMSVGFKSLTFSSGLLEIRLSVAIDDGDIDAEIFN